MYVYACVCMWFYILPGFMYGFVYTKTFSMLQKFFGWKLSMNDVNWADIYWIDLHGFNAVYIYTESDDVYCVYIDGIYMCVYSE